MTEENIQKKWIETENGKIFYFFDKSFPDRPFVIFLHGLSANHTTWVSTAKILKSKKINFIIPDLRGHGYSDKTKKSNLYKLPVFTEDVKDILKKENVNEAIFVGYSFGGQIALDYAIKYPDSVKALILIGTNHVNPLIYRWFSFLIWPMYWFVRIIAGFFLWQSRKEYYYFEQGKSTGYWNSTLKGFTTMPVSVNLWMLSEMANLDLREKIEKILCPTLLIKSDADQFLREEEVASIMKNIKNSKLISISGNSHFLARIFESRIANDIETFLVKERLL